MKKIIYRGLFLATIGLGFISCEKQEIETISNSSINTDTQNRTKTTSRDLEITYRPATEQIADQLIKSLLDNTVFINSSEGNSSDIQKDHLPEEGVWMMEAAANYLTNVNLESTSSDEIFQINLSVDNYLSDDVIKMNNTDMYYKFEKLLTTIYSHASELNKLPRLVDFKRLEITNSETILQAYVVYGDEVLQSVTFPTTKS